MRNVKADLHNHLKTYSGMSGLFNKTIDRARDRLGQGGVIGVVNFSDERYEEFSDESGYDRKDLGNAVYVPEKDILVVKGQEVPTRQGHLLVLGLERKTHLKERRTLEDTIEEAKDYGGIIIADHPFFHEGIGPYLQQHPEILSQIDAIEVHNGEASSSFFGRLPKEANPKAQMFYEAVKETNPHLSALSSSDGHSLFELGTSWTELVMSRNYAEFTKPEQVVRELINGMRSTRAFTLSQRRTDSVAGLRKHVLELLPLVVLNKIKNKLKL